jgi:hypothetical protein
MSDQHDAVEQEREMREHEREARERDPQERRPAGAEAEDDPTADVPPAPGTAQRPTTGGG